MLLRMRARVRDLQASLRALLVLGWLLLLTAIFGCGGRDAVKEKDLGPIALYGPPASDWRAPNPDGARDAGTDCTPVAVALYGPQPCASDQDCVNRAGAGWYCDKSNTYSDSCGTKMAWPVCREGAASDGSVVSRRDGCMPVTLYGPRPCSTDAECVSENGVGWYCDKTNSYPDGCGGRSVWPLCKQGTVKKDAGLVAKDACMPVTLYGPPPCSTDTDCQSWYGSSYTCNKTTAVSNGCGEVSTWATCQEKK